MLALAAIATCIVINLSAIAWTLSWPPSKYRQRSFVTNLFAVTFNAVVFAIKVFELLKGAHP